MVCAVAQRESHRHVAGGTKLLGTKANGQDTGVRLMSH